MIEDLAGCVAVVTGAGSGIGRATALRLSERGATLALFDISETGLEETRSLVPTSSFSFTVDVSDASQVERAATDVAAQVGDPRLLVLSAGLLGPRDTPIWESPDEDWSRVFAVNLFGAVNCVRAFVPPLENSLGPSHISIIASSVGLWAPKRAGIYGASKHALVSLAETLRSELQSRSSSIGVSLICPRGVRTPFNSEIRGADPEWNRPGPRLIEADDVAVKVVQGITDGRFYVFTNDGTKEALMAYHDDVLNAFW